MKAPIKCPVCGDPMLNEFIDHVERINKSCKLRLDHSIVMMVIGDRVYRLTIMISTNLYATWYFPVKEIHLYTTNDDKKRGVITKLPFFEPDISNYKKLVEKVKTYLLFS